MDRDVYFCHIPKTGGTTLRLAIEEKFPQDQILPNKSDIETNGGLYPSTSAVTDLFLQRRADVRLLRGHYHYSFYKILKNPIKIVVLREPIARSISLFKHMVTVGKVNADTIREALDEGHFPAPDNMMTRFLAGSLASILPTPLDNRHNHLMRRELTPQALESAKMSLKSVDILGLTEHLDLMIDPLAKLGIAFDATARVNVSRVDSFALTDSQLDTIRAHNKFDEELYATALDLVSPGMPADYLTQA